ncbi:MAG: hypothetical protein HOQ05_14395 [Corynebacteriales bacterium]|nr:hypothetical protein [Mycobacteriales bacterium]
MQIEDMILTQIIKTAHQGAVTGANPVPELQAIAAGRIDLLSAAARQLASAPGAEDAHVRRRAVNLLAIASRTA